MHKKAIDSFTDFLNSRWAFGVVLWELVTLGKYVLVVVDMLKSVEAEFDIFGPLYVTSFSSNEFINYSSNHALVFLAFWIGGTPYPTINNRELLSLLKGGYRMGKPDTCSEEM